MIIKYLFFVLISSYLKYANCAVFLNEKSESNCNTLIKENQKSLQEISANLETSSRKLDTKHEHISKVFESLDESIKKSMKIAEGESVESFLIKHQLLLHQMMKEMITEFKTIFSRQKRSYTISASKDEIYSEDRSNEARKSKISEDNVFKGNKNYEVTNFNSFDGANSYSATDNAFRPTDCSELLVSGQTESGFYFIYPFKCHCTQPVKVYCDMETDGGGWTVFLQRTNASKPLNFTKNWDSYKKGFGNERDFWLGNDALHTLTFNRNYALRMEAKDNEQREIWGLWNSIVVHSEDEKFKLMVTGHDAKSTAFDRFAYVTNNFFSTFDADNDKHSTLHCAQSFRGGWWYNACHHNNPTGEYGKPGQDGLIINPWSKTDKVIRQATWLQLKIRPLVCSSHISVIQLNKHNCPYN